MLDPASALTLLLIFLVLFERQLGALLLLIALLIWLFGGRR